MGKHFGNLQKLTGVTYYSLSPYELKLFKGFFNPGFFNVLRKVRSSGLFVVIPALVLYTGYEYVQDELRKKVRKNPDDYKDDV